MFKNYLSLTKPGIIIGNVISSAAGFFLASKGYVDLGLFVAAMMGITFVIASSCVFNNYIDRDVDRHMDRTKNRVLVNGSIAPINAIIYGIILGVIGFSILYFYTNFLTVLIGAVGVVFYIVLYGITKRGSIFGTIVGSVSGATPIVAGYCAVTNSFDVGALILFVILVTWQMPHFYAISIFRLADYTNAKVPVLPVVKGILVTKLNIALYTVAFIIATFLLTDFGYTGYMYLVIMGLLGLIWLYYIVRGFKTDDDQIWARQMFKYSLKVLTIFCVLVSINSLLR